MGWPGDCLSRKSGFPFAKAYFVGGSCITSCAGGLRTCSVHLGFVKDVEIQLIGLIPSACSAILHRTSRRGVRNTRICHIGLWRCKGKGCGKI